MASIPPASAGGSKSPPAARELIPEKPVDPRIRRNHANQIRVSIPASIWIVQFFVVRGCNRIRPVDRRHRSKSNNLIWNIIFFCDLNQFLAASSIKIHRLRIPTLSTFRVLETLNCRKCKLELKHCRKSFCTASRGTLVCELLVPGRSR